MKTQKTTRRTILSGALIVGAILFTLNAGLYLVVLTADAIWWWQTGGGGSQLLGALHLPTVLLVAVIVTALPVGLWACVLRRATAEQLSATRTAHGKYPPGGTASAATGASRRGTAACGPGSRSGPSAARRISPTYPLVTAPRSVRYNGDRIEPNGGNA